MANHLQHVMTHDTDTLHTPMQQATHLEHDMIAHDALDGLDELRGERERVLQVLLAHAHKRRHLLAGSGLLLQTLDGRVVVGAILAVHTKFLLLRVGK